MIGRSFIYHFVMSDLRADTVYYYQCGSPTAGVSAVIQFTSNPVIGPDRSVVLAVLGVLGLVSFFFSSIPYIA